MKRDDYRYMIALSCISGIGARRAKALISAFGGSAEEVLRANKKELSEVEGIGTTIADVVLSGKSQALARADKELEFIDRYKIDLLAYTDSEYSNMLRQCDDGPIILYTRGTCDMNVPKVLSIVGTREPTDYGRELCDRLVGELAQRHPGTLIVSGLAYGIDITAHRSAIRNGLQTVGVLAHGLDRIYPQQHRNTAAQMANGSGGLVTEFLSGTRPEASNFKSRNRIIAGLAQGILVVESGTKGGSLITAHFGNEYDRDVMAIPGSLYADKSRGCNSLIKCNMAHLVETVEDIEKVLGWTPHDAREKKKPEQGSLFVNIENEIDRKIYDALQAEGSLTSSLLSQRCGVPISDISSHLFELELNGVVKSLPGNSYKLAR